MQTLARWLRRRRPRPLPAAVPPRPRPAVVQGLWIGPELSVMERLSIASFLANGHPYHLYAYGRVNGVPPGAEVRDAEEILPASAVFQYGNGSFAGFANFFRYKLLAERGGWWADADVVCLRRFAFAEPHVFARERTAGGEVPTSGVIKAPPGSPAMAWAWRKCEGRDTARLEWGETGPQLVAHAIRTFSLQRYLQPAWVFSPLGFEEWRRVLAPRPPRFPRGTRAVHLWNEMWRRARVDKNARFHPGSLYERLKRTYLDQA